MAYPPPAYAPRPAAARTRRRWPRRLVITLIVLALVLVGIDRGGVVVAERIAGDTIQNSQHLDERPDVNIAGFPFLTQLASGHYDDVTITVHGLLLGQGKLERPFRLDSLVVHLHGVTVPRDFSSISAASATAQAHGSYAALSTTLGTPVRYGGPQDGGRVTASGRITVAGTALSGTVSAAMRASSAEGLRFVDPQVTAGGQQVPALTSALEAIFSIAIPLEGLPFDTRVDGLDVTSDGLQLHLSGTNLTYSKS